MSHLQFAQATFEIAAVPEIAIAKNGHARWRVNNIRPAGQLGDILSKAYTARRQCAPKDELGLGISL